jgi:hypothetical protein
MLRDQVLLDAGTDACVGEVRLGLFDELAQLKSIAADKRWGTAPGIAERATLRHSSDNSSETASMRECV